jgi:pimeloyl-ACP methyl ester carboxylesterase
VAAVIAGDGRISAESSWSDPETGSTEEAAFVGSGGERILAFLHRPTSGAVNGGVLLCSSLYEDLPINYRAEILVARALARRGYAVVRFQYRGAGNSEDLGGRGMTFQTMVADARTAASWLMERSGGARLTVCGSRLGALVASELASLDDRAPLVLWSPIVNGADFFRGMSRANLLAGVRAEARKRQAPGDVERRLFMEGPIEMLGNVVHRESYEDLTKRRLPPTVGPGRRVLLVQLGLGNVENPQYDELVSRWTADGSLVEVLRVRARQLWMVPDNWEPEDNRPTTQDLVAGIAGWVDATAREPS